MGISPNAEPGTGTQVHSFASPPEDESRPNTYTIGEETWACGREYWDSMTKDLVTLVEVIGRSTWCDTREPEECPPKLVFERDMPSNTHNGRFMVDPFDPNRSPSERFTLRSIPDPAGMRREVWPGIPR